MISTNKFYFNLYKKIALLLSVLLLCSCVIFGMLSFTAYAEDDDEEKSSNFYEFTNVITRVTDASLSKAQKGDHPDEWALDKSKIGSYCTGQSGGFWGYSYEEEGFFSSIKSYVSQNTAEYSKEMLKAFDKDAAGISGGSPSVAYMHYGYALSQLGLDKVTSRFGNFLPAAARMLLYAFYILSSAVGYLFSFVLNILKLLNPFRFLTGVYDSLKGSVSRTGTWGQDLFTKVDGFFAIVKDSALVAISLILAITLMYALLSRGASNRRSGSPRRAVGFFILRVFFLVLAIPVIGSAYSGILDKLSDISGNASSAQDQVICSVIVDFEHWATLQRLKLPKDVVIKVDTKTGDPQSGTTPSQTIARRINAQLGYTVDPDGNSDKIKKQEITSIKQSVNQSKEVLALLKKYQGAETIKPSSYESSLKAKMSDPALFRTIATAESADDIEGFFNGRMQNDEKTSTVGINYSNSYAGDGYLKRSGGTYSMSVNAAMPTIADLSSSGSSGIYIKHDGGALSCLAMYNYLNSSFDSNAITVFSSKNTMSENSRTEHMSATLVGNGMAEKFLNFLNALMVLLVLTVVGFVYAISLMTMSVRNGVLLLTNAPFAMIGSVQYIARFIKIFIVLVVELISTLFFYAIFSELLVSSQSVFTFDGLPSAVNVVGTLAHTFIVGFIGFWSIKNRKIVAKTIDEVLTDVIRRITNKPADRPGSPANPAVNTGTGGGASPRAFSPIAPALEGANGNNDGADTSDGQGDGDVSDETDVNTNDYGGGAGLDKSGANANVSDENNFIDASQGRDLEVDDADPANDIDNYEKDGSSKERSKVSALGDAVNKAKSVKAAAADNIAEKKEAVANSKAGKAVAKRKKALQEAPQMTTKAGRKALSDQKNDAKHRKVLKENGIHDSESFARVQAQAKKSGDHNLENALRNAHSTVARASGIPISGTNHKVKGELKGNMANCKTYNKLAKKAASGTITRAELNTMNNCKQALKQAGIPINSNGYVSKGFMTQYAKDYTNNQEGRIGSK